MDSTIIRSYQNSDEQQVIDIWFECELAVPWNNPKRDIERKMKDDPSLFIVCEVNEIIIGTCMAGYDGHRDLIYSIAVSSEYRKQVAICNNLFYISDKNRIREDSTMTTAVRVSQKLVREAKIYSKIDKRSVTGQIEHWARIGKCAEENPDLTYSLIKEILIGLVELEQGESSEYKFG